MTSVFVANGLAFGAWAGNIPRLREQAGLDEASLGITLLSVSLGAVAAIQLAGLFAARIGLVRGCWGGALLLAAAMPVPALAPSWPALLAAGVLLGFGMGWVDVCMNAHAAGMERRWGAAIMSSFHAGWSLGQLLGAGLAGVLATIGLGLTASLATAGLGIAALGLAGLALSDGNEAPERAGFAWPTRGLLALCAVLGGSFAVEGAVADWSGVYLKSSLGASDAGATTSLAVFAATMVACRLVGDRVVRWLGPLRVVTWGALLAAAGLMLAIAAPSVWVAAAAFALVGLGVANIVPVAFSAAAGQGTAAFAMVSTAGYGAVMAAPPLIGFVSHGFGLRTGLACLVAACIGMAVARRRV